jgi:hypothetical protein
MMSSFSLFFCLLKLAARRMILLGCRMTMLTYAGNKIKYQRGTIRDPEGNSK